MTFEATGSSPVAGANSMNSDWWANLTLPQAIVASTALVCFILFLKWKD